MKRKTNLSVLDNLGLRREVNILVGEKTTDYSSGDILDANSTKDLITTNVQPVISRVVVVENKVRGLEEDPAAGHDDLQNLNAKLSTINDDINSVKIDITNQDKTVQDLEKDVTSLKNLISADDPVGAIDKFDEIVDFLNDVEDTTLNSILSNFVRSNNIQDVVRTSDITDVVRTSDISDTVKSNTVRNIITLTQSQYDALETKSSNVEYNIIES